MSETVYNILMFGDNGWDLSMAELQEQRLREWVRSLGSANVVVVECGAGTAVPSIRYFSERFIRDFRGRLIRINIREPETPPGHIGLSMGALAALRAIDQLLLGESVHSAGEA